MLEESKAVVSELAREQMANDAARREAHQKVQAQLVLEQKLRQRADAALEKAKAALAEAHAALGAALVPAAEYAAEAKGPGASSGLSTLIQVRTMVQQAEKLVSFGGVMTEAIRAGLSLGPSALQQERATVSYPKGAQLASEHLCGGSIGPVTAAVTAAVTGPNGPW